MGQAKLRGSREDRIAQARARERARQEAVEERSRRAAAGMGLARLPDRLALKAGDLVTIARLASAGGGQIVLIERKDPKGE